MANNYTKNLSLLLFATLFISTSGVLGKYIEMPAELIVFFRALLAGIFIYIFCKITNVSLKISSKKDAVAFVITGFLLGAHWVSYFYALKLSNVAIGMLSMFTFPVITAFLEPIFNKEKLSLVHVLLASLILVGLYILLPEFSIENDEVKGICLAVFSAFLYATRNLLVKRNVKSYNGSTLMFYQMVVVTVFLIPVLFFADFSNVQSQIPLLILVALLTTAIGHTMLVNSFKHFSVTTASIIGSLQPIFGIIIAFIFVNEVPNVNTFIGGSLILATVVIESLRSKKQVDK
jgi:drug/metabolite transporter (DMT)-like permease